jgi:malate dehydrogenase (oxaloacetate-decarboxylating)
MRCGMPPPRRGFDTSMPRWPSTSSAHGCAERPVIFPLSNPSTQSEAKAEDLIRWTDGRPLVATGSPFPLSVMGARRIPIAQCAKVYIFPAMGLGVVASRARKVTEPMLLAAARALGAHSPALKDPSASLLPALTEIMRATTEIALAVGIEAQKDLHLGDHF